MTEVGQVYYCLLLAVRARLEVDGKPPIEKLIGYCSFGAPDAELLVPLLLLHVQLIETLRSSTETAASPGLLRGLTDDRLTGPLRAIHAAPDRAWSVADLASEARLSRSAFFTRFNREVGMAPMEYLQRWRMTVARHMLQSRQHSISEIAAKVGYGSTSAFSSAFARRTGMPPAQYARGA